MSRLVGLTLVLLTFTGTVAQAQDTSPEAADSRGNRILWLEPLSTTLGVTYTASRQDERLTMLSGGYAHPLGARRSLATELFVLNEEVGCREPTDTCSGGTAVRASVGLAYSFGGSPGRGFLLQPRLILGYFHDRALREQPPLGETSGTHGFSLQAGLDVGYQWRLGPVYLALVGGLAAGVSSINVDVPPFITTDPSFTKVGGLELRPALGLNLHLLRLGFAF